MVTSEPIKFLLIDDMSENLFAIEAIIRRKDLEVLVARSGSDALDLLLVHDVSLALLDVQMPGMDGFELAELMRGVERTKHVPIIFVTAGARDPKRVFKGYESGAVDFLFKPIDPHILKSKADVFFDLAQQRRATSQIHEEILAMNEALVRGSLRQRELIEVGDSLNVQLQSEIRERKLVEAEQEKLHQRLREANEELQRFTYIVGHDLRSPLVNIMGFAREIDAWRTQVFERIGTLRAQIGGEQDDKGDDALGSDVEESLGFIKSSVAKMDRLIAALLKLSREGQRQLQPQFVDMSQLLRSTLEALAYQAQAVNAKISIGELPTITSDRLALEQVFSNLLDNAVKYLRVDVPGSIEVRGAESDGAITYEVRDNGRGIDAADRERIFDLFRRSGIQDRPGDGIGLAHVRALVRRLGGSINVESEPDRGTVFKVTLPKRWHQRVSEVNA